MNDLDIETLSREELIEHTRKLDSVIFTLVAEGHDKDVLIQNLRTFNEELQRRKLQLLDRVLEQRKSFNLRKDCHDQEMYFLEEELKARDSHIEKLEKEIRTLRSRVSI